MMEFKKALIMDPANKTAKAYISDIFKKEVSSGKAVPTGAKQQFAQTQNRDEVINRTLDSLTRKESKEAPEQGEPWIKVSGQTQLSAGVTSEDAIWNQADSDLNEENFRTLSTEAYNRRANTFDTRIYDRLRVNLDSQETEGFGFHTNVTVDPWSFTGKSDKITVSGVSPLTDTADVELFAWGNTVYTVGHTAYTKQRGDSFSLSETKIVNEKVPSKTITSVNSNIFIIPEAEIEYEFQPVRELWLNYKQEGLDLRFFPIAYQDQAYTSDDPLRLSNNRNWWQQSPWIDTWRPGNFNSGLNDFRKGKFDESLSYRTRDSDGIFLTALRGASLSFYPDEATSFDSTVASPKLLWQDYESVDNVSSASRFKHYFTENFLFGGTYTYRVGFNEDLSSKKDYSNHVIGADVGYQIKDGLKASAEAAQSFSKKDLSTSDFSSESRGNAYYLSLTGRFPEEDIMGLEGYDAIKPEEYESFFAKARLFYAHMDRGFDPALSTYRETRDDAFWSRHISFRKPFAYYYSGLYYPALKWEDVEPYRIGNGIDIGRDVVGLRVETSFFDQALDNLFDVRNVRSTGGKIIENVTRDEVTYNFDERLTGKLMGIYHKLPKTKANKDPFIFDKSTDLYVDNNTITDGEDPSLKTGSVGLEYALTDWAAVSGIWERTNDYNLAYDNFPRGNLNGVFFTTFNEYDKTYRIENPFVYSQGLFPTPPYPYYNIFKSGLRLTPVKDLEIYLDYTRNEFKSAGQIDDNINHIGFEASYLPFKKLGVYFKYVYSRWNDLTLMTQGYSKYYLSHHNFFTELRYLPDDFDEFVFQYGEAGRSNVSTTYTDPFSSGLPVLDTQHIFRVYYRRKF